MSKYDFINDKFLAHYECDVKSLRDFKIFDIDDNYWLTNNNK